MLTGLRRLPGFTLTVTGTAQSSEKVVDEELFVADEVDHLGLLRGDRRRERDALHTGCGAGDREVAAHRVGRPHREGVGVEWQAGGRDRDARSSDRGLRHIAVGRTIRTEVGHHRVDAHRYGLADDTERIADRSARR